MKVERDINRSHFKVLRLRRGKSWAIYLQIRMSDGGLEAWRADAPTWEDALSYVRGALSSGLFWGYQMVPLRLFLKAEKLEKREGGAK